MTKEKRKEIKMMLILQTIQERKDTERTTYSKL